MGRESCPVPGIDELVCEWVVGLAGSYGVPADRLVSDIVGSVVSGYPYLFTAESTGYNVLLSLLAASPGLLQAIEYPLSARISIREL